MTEIPDQIIKSAIRAVMLETERQPSPYLFTKWEFEPGLTNGMSRTCIRVSGSITAVIGPTRSQGVYSDFFEGKKFGRFCEYFCDAMAADGYTVETVMPIWLTSDESWALLVGVRN